MFKHRRLNYNIKKLKSFFQTLKYKLISLEVYLASDCEETSICIGMSVGATATTALLISLGIAKISPFWVLLPMSPFLLMVVLMLLVNHWLSEEG